MTYDPMRHHRRSIRLRGYDYAQAGAYFVTICVQDRACLFGEVIDSEVRLNEAGRMVVRWWDELARAYLGIDSDAFIAMPNHVHGIIVLGARPDELEGGGGPDDEGRHIGLPLPDNAVVGADLRVRPPGDVRRASLSRVVQWFKTMTTNEYIQGVRNLEWPPFRGRLWQRNYYEHVIRDERSLERLRDYVAGNPAGWPTDRLHPDVTSKR